MPHPSTPPLQQKEEGAREKGKIGETRVVKRVKEIERKGSKG